MFSSLSFTFHNEQIKSCTLLRGLGSLCSLLGGQIVKQHRICQTQASQITRRAEEGCELSEACGLSGAPCCTHACLPNQPQRRDPIGSLQYPCPLEIWTLWVFRARGRCGGSARRKLDMVVVRRHGLLGIGPSGTAAPISVGCMLLR